MQIPSILSTIRFKVIVGFLIAFVGMTLFGGLSYRHFVGIQERLYFLSQADQMVNTVLEVRRYEKNYFLYRNEKDYELALEYLQQFEKSLWGEPRGPVRWISPGVAAALSQQSSIYRANLDRAHDLLTRAQTSREQAPSVHEPVRAIRKAGQALIRGTEGLAADERARVQGLLQDYLPLLIVFLVSLGLVGVLLIFLLTRRLVRPLQRLEDATNVVAQGNFQTIAWQGEDDEIGSVVRAFNRMVVELSRNNEYLVQAEKLTALGTLTSGVAHELNNPLNNISTSCQILLEELGGKASDYHRELLSAMDGQVEKAKDIVGSLLEFARQRDFMLRPEDIREVVEEAIKLIKAEIPDSVEVRVNVASGIVAEVDKGHLVQAMLNLAMNGIQAMEKSGGTLSIWARTDSSNREAIIEVTDTGEGIGPEIMPRIFDPFFTTKEVGRGTGLGLSITYGIVERHQGSIVVESEAGKGARFILRLPLQAARS